MLAFLACVTVLLLKCGIIQTKLEDMGCAAVQYLSGDRYKNNANLARLVLCVDEIEGIFAKGRLFSAYLQCEHPFSCFEDIIHLSELIFDLNSFPQSSFGKRYFRSSSEKLKIKREDIMKNLQIIDEKQLKRGEKGTFVVRVMFRQNATWQGTVSWVEGNKTQHFRSMLELIHLLEDALGTEAIVWDSGAAE